MAIDNVIKANPTKDFFIKMLTKDIPLTRAIIDLVDNSVDGALRLRPNNDYSGLKVQLTIKDDEFVIEDNCGGIPLDVAKLYAFRFGRPKEAISTPNSVGLFGVGMKRAIFKMGNSFSVDSKTETDYFRVEQNIPAWSELEEWEFHFEEVKDATKVLNVYGTRIAIRELHGSISEQFKLKNFLINLRIQLEAAQQISLERGLTIVLNDVPLQPSMLYLYNTESIQPGFASFALDAYPKVNVAIYTGIFERDLVKGGWYLPLCQDR